MPDLFFDFDHHWDRVKQRKDSVKFLRDEKREREKREKRKKVRF